jgi:hypothetical protein
LCWHKVAGGRSTRQQRPLLPASTNRLWPSGGSRTSRRRRPSGAPPVMGTSMMGAARPHGSPSGLGLVHRRFLASNRRRPAPVPGLVVAWCDASRRGARWRRRLGHAGGRGHALYRRGRRGTHAKVGGLAAAHCRVRRGHWQVLGPDGHMRAWGWAGGDRSGPQARPKPKG